MIDSLKDGDIGSLSGQANVSSNTTISNWLGGMAPILTLILALLWALSTIYRKDNP